MSNLNPQDISFVCAAEFYLKKYRKGEAPPVGVYAKAFPHLTEQLRSELPLMLMLEEGLGQAKPAVNVPLNGQFGSCEVLDQIGRGGMGTVFKARQKELDRTVAVKVIELQDGLGHRLERFELERRAQARLEHPNIVPVYEFGHEGGYAFLIMKYVEGFDLAKIINEQSNYRAKVKLAELHSDWWLFAKIGADIASGLQHAHDQGLVHRDVKPSNLLLDNNDNIWITDFGLAKLADHSRSLSDSGDAIGTPRYMAPEQLRGASDARSDVFSLGLTLYELAIGGLAWNTDSAEALPQLGSEKVLPDVRTKNTAVPVALAKIIMKACSLESEERYQSAAEMEIVLRRFSEGCPAGDRRRRKTRPTDAEYRKRKIRNRVIALAASAIVATGGYEFVSRKPTTVSEPKVASEEFAIPISKVKLLDRLIDEDGSEDVVDVVADFVKESFDESSDDLGLRKDTKKALLEKIDRVTENMKTPKFDNERANAIFQNYKQSNLIVGAKIARLHSVVERSSLTDAEKQSAIDTLRKFAYAASKGILQKEEANGIVDALTHGRTYSAEELETFVADEAKLRKWLRRVDNRVSTIELGDESEYSIIEEVEQLFQSPESMAPSNEQAKSYLQTIDRTKKAAKAAPQRSLRPTGPGIKRNPYSSPRK